MITPKEAPKAKRAEVLASYGASRRRVRVVRRLIADTPKLVAEWYVNGVRREKSWPDTRANLRVAKEWAETFARERLLPRAAETPRLTNRALWDLYTTAEFPLKRENTIRLYSDSWRLWELYAGRDFIAEDATNAMIHGFRRALEQKGLGVNSLRHTIQNVKTVYGWAEREELITKNRFRLFKLKFAKDALPESPAEYTDEEFRRLLAQLDPTDGREWRAWVALMILGGQGVRQVAGLQLEWAMVDVRTRQIHWPARTDKNGRAWSQPLRKATVRALRVARDWARRLGRESRFVLPAGSSLSRRGHYSTQSLWTVLQNAEKRAGIEHKPYRGAHGLRRLLAGDVAEFTGNALLGLRAIGDRDPRMAQRYIKKRDRAVAGAFRQLDRKASAKDAKTGAKAAAK